MQLNISVSAQICFMAIMTYTTPLHLLCCLTSSIDTMPGPVYLL